MDVAIIIAYFNFSGTPARKQVLRQTLISLQGTADVFLVCHKTPNLQTALLQKPQYY